MAALAGAFWVPPPLTAFTLYFVGLHAPRHMRALVRDPTRAPGVDTMPKAIRAPLPVLGLTLLLGAALWPLYTPGSPDAATLPTLTLRMLSALTVPHVLLDRIAARDHDRPSIRPTAACLGGRDDPDAMPAPHWLSS